MKNKIIILFILLFVFGCSSKDNESNKNRNASNELNALTEAEIAEGWQLLFDGKTFNGWRGIGKDLIPEGHWKIEDNSIRKISSGDVPTMPDGQPLKGGDLITDRTFNNFEFTFEWKISEGGNSGVKYNVVEEVSIKNESSNALGFEYQILDDDEYADNLKPTQITASLYDIIGASGRITKPVGEFNTGRIVYNKNHGEHWLNGVKVVEYDIDTPLFEKLFQNSKYHTHVDFIKHKIARIVLQDHGDDCWYRNIKIREL